MKKIIVVLIVLLSASAAVFANGAQENAGPGAPAVQEEPVTISGKLELNDDRFPILKSGNTEWMLMYPPVFADEINVKTGDTISVKGFEVPGPRWADADKKFLMVQQAEIAGKTYIIPRGYGPQGGRGPRGGGRGFSGGCPYADEGFQGGRGPGMMGGRGGRW